MNNHNEYIPPGSIKNPPRYEFKDGRRGMVVWHRGSIFGLFTTDNGEQFSVTDVDVTRIKTEA